MKQEDKNRSNDDSVREGGDEALSNLRQKDNRPSEKQEAGYGNEQRIAEESEGRNMPLENNDPAGSGIASKE